MSILQWNTKSVMVKNLIISDINPRKITDIQMQNLVSSINKFNLADIPTVNLDYKIIGGAQRVTALLLLGRADEFIDVRIPNRMLSDDEVKQYMLISNTHAGVFDFDLLNQYFSDIDINSIWFPIPGLDDFRSELDKATSDNITEDDFDVPSNGKDTDITDGDIIDIGPHRLICGSSTNEISWAQIMNTDKADLVITDPPYNVNYVGKTKDNMTILNDNMSSDSFYEFLLDFNTSLGKFSKPGCSWYIWHADTEGHNFRMAMINSGIKLSQCLMWVKNSLVLGRNDYHWKHEPCLYGWTPGAPHKWYSDRSQTTVLEFDRPSRNDAHPTMKPVKLISYLIQNSSKIGDIICDGFGGSGTTMVAAHLMGRYCRMIELDPRYCQVIIERMCALDKDLTIKINGVLWSMTKKH